MTEQSALNSSADKDQNEVDFSDMSDEELARYHRNKVQPYLVIDTKNDGCSTTIPLECVTLISYDKKSNTLSVGIGRGVSTFTGISEKTFEHMQSTFKSFCYYKLLTR